MAETEPYSESNKRKYVRWRPIFLVHIYRHAKAGLSDEAIARVLEINRNTIKLWKSKNKDVREAMRLARDEVPPEEGFVKFFYDRLEPRLQALWDSIDNVDRLGGGPAAVEALLGDHDPAARQALFLRALVTSHFSPYRAMQKVGIDKRTLRRWEQDQDFMDLYSQIAELKGEYFEESLVKLVQEGNPGAIMFVNRTYNKKKGYGNELNVNVTGEVEHRLVLDLSELDLDLDTRVKILEAVRRRDEKLEQQRKLSQMPLEQKLLNAVEDAVVDRIRNGSPADG